MFYCIVIELEPRRILFNEIKDYLEFRGIPGDTLQFDYDVEAWVVGCYIAGKTLTEAKKNIFENL